MSMDMATGGLDPREFAATAQRAVAACAGAEPAAVLAEQHRGMAEPGSAKDG